MTDPRASSETQKVHRETIQAVSFAELRADVKYIREAVDKGVSIGFPRCAEQKERVNGIDMRLKWLYGIVAGVILMLLREVFSK